ncbi:MAG TPA: hypothetical protein VF079_01730 [Sphingomicrobium sp.]
MAAALMVWPAAALAAGKTIAVKCVGQGSAVAHASTDEMIGWLSKSAAAYESKDAFTISGHGGMGRMFDASGRLIHPRELAESVRASSAFTGKKAKLVDLAVSGTGGPPGRSYADRLAALLRTKVNGCEGIAYYLSNGLYLCGKEPPAAQPAATRLLPLGFMPTRLPMFMIFCQPGTSPDPRTLMSSQAAFGLFPDEMAQLEAAGQANADAAFRLYLYHWLARRDRSSAMSWLKKAAELGSDVARFDLAYEYFESGDSKHASELMATLVAKGFAGPDLRNYYGGSERG